ncbi:MAG: glycosyltransferase [Candidatus Altiarchaeota archaeon]|nr:glycosyltransferase [Candidatus Altiarchaeota archaeon]
MKITVISTLLNEGNNADFLMQSLFNQKRMPEEIVVVDGGSTDNTVERLKSWKKKFSTKDTMVRILQAEGTNIARGRNLATEQARHPWIASIDGGCTAEKDWLEKLEKKAESTQADVVSGNFRPRSENFSEKVQGVFVRISAKDNPSSRSIMFKKLFWKRAGGYPEKLYTGEDTLFNATMKAKGAKFVFAPGAMVNWGMRPNLKKWLKQFFLYGYGDGMARIKSDTAYGKKVWTLVAGFYAFVAAAIFYPILLPLPFLGGLLYGLKRKFAPEGVIAGILYPLRLLVFLVGFHKGLLTKS